MVKYHHNHTQSMEVRQEAGLLATEAVTEHAEAAHFGEELSDDDEDIEAVKPNKPVPADRRKIRSWDRVTACCQRG